jgi:hypothetical protein
MHPVLKIDCPAGLPADQPHNETHNDNEHHNTGHSKDHGSLSSFPTDNRSRLNVVCLNNRAQPGRHADHGEGDVPGPAGAVRCGGHEDGAHHRNSQAQELFLSFGHT